MLALRDLFQAVYQQKQREESFRRSSRVSNQSESSDHRVSVTSSNPSISQSDLFPPASPALSPATGAAAAYAPSPQLSSHSSQASSRLSGSQLYHDNTPQVCDLICYYSLVVLSPFDYSILNRFQIEKIEDLIIHRQLCLFLATVCRNFYFSRVI